MKAKKKSRAGFGLLEIMITISLVLLGLLVVWSSMVAMAKSNRYSERMDVANTIARHEMEHVRNMRFDHISSETGSYGEYATHPDYRHQTIVSSVGELKEVSVRVLFENDRRQFEILTFVANL